jgi:hypothetical protein
VSTVGAPSSRLCPPPRLPLVAASLGSEPAGQAARPLAWTIFTRCARSPGYARVDGEREVRGARYLRRSAIAESQGYARLLRMPDLAPPLMTSVPALRSTSSGAECPVTRSWRMPSSVIPAAPAGNSARVRGPPRWFRARGSATEPLSVLFDWFGAPRPPGAERVLLGDPRAPSWRAC